MERGPCAGAVHSTAPVSPFADTVLGPVGARETHPSAAWKELVTWGETQTLNSVLSFLEGNAQRNLGVVQFSVCNAGTRREADFHSVL